MTRSEVREFLLKGVNALLPVPEFGSGLLTDFNWISSRSPDYPKVWQLIGSTSVEEGTSAPTESYQVELLICKKDQIESVPTAYEELIDECDDMARQLTYKYRNIIEGYKLLTMTGITREPFVKKNGAACMTGIQLSFTIVSQNRDNVC